MGLVYELHFIRWGHKIKNYWQKCPLHKKRSFLLRISFVNLMNYTRKCGFYHIYYKIFNRKLHFLFCSGINTPSFFIYFKCHFCFIYRVDEVRIRKKFSATYICIIMQHVFKLYSTIEAIKLKKKILQKFCSLLHHK